MVRLPASSEFLAAPKSCLGTSSAFESIPPDIVRPLDACLRERLNARPSLVSESRSMTTCFPASTLRFARSMAIVLMATCVSTSWSLLEPMTLIRSWWSWNERLKSVTSSGRSSMRRMSISRSWWFARSPEAMFLRSVVLPAFGGLTMSPRWPLPIGQKRSMSRHAGAQPGCSSVSLGAGSMLVSSSKGLTAFA